MFTNFWEEKQYPPKVMLMNEAVIALLSEGRDINSLKVSEITQKAGIGKGTAYEYFVNKEEMIAAALEYNLASVIANLVEREADAVDFRDMLVRMTEWLAENYRQNVGFTLLFQKEQQPQRISIEMRRALQDKCPGTEVVEQMIEQVLAVGEKEGIIQKKHPYYGTVAIISQIMAYTFYLSDENLAGEISEADARDFVVENIIKMLN